MKLERAEILGWLRETDPVVLERLWSLADSVRREHVGDEVHLRGLLEISNHCVRRCAYCGISVANAAIERYRMSAEEILDGARTASEYGYGTVVMQAGEDYGLRAEIIADIVRRIKTETGLAVTLSLGERPEKELALWKEAGADRYLLRFETSDRALYDSIHPSHGGRLSDRIEQLRLLRRLGYEIGSGVMVGIPGQTVETLASDVELFRELDLDMIGVGPFIPHPATPLGASAVEPEYHEEMTYKMIALARLACPEANIPSTTALATLNRDTGRELGLSRGANIVMPNVTPVKYRVMYEIYPAKACVNETAEACRSCLSGRIMAMGRSVGTGKGSRIRRSGRVF